MEPSNSKLLAPTKISPTGLMTPTAEVAGANDRLDDVLKFFFFGFGGRNGVPWEEGKAALVLTFTWEHESSSR